MAEAKDDENATNYKLEADTELRFEVERGASVQLELMSGKAEIFGSELTKTRKYTFTCGSKVAVFTWHGCVVNMYGKMEVAYTATNTPMVMYMNVHSALEQMRIKAEGEMGRGPRVMIVGPMDVGKSTLCKMLVNYAARQNRAPALVDLDVGQNEISIPGTIASIIIERPSEVEESYSLVAPLVYHFGHKSPSENLQLYNALVSRLADIVNMRCETNPKTNVSGVVINTCGWVHGAGYQCLVHAASVFEIDVLIVLDQERLHSQLVKNMPDFVKVVLLPKSGGVVERSKNVRAERRDNKIREYFYGIQGNLCPHTFEIRFADVQIFKIGAPELPISMLPLDMVVEDSRTKLVPIQPSGSLIHHVLSTSMANSVDDDVVLSNVSGFIVITEANMDKRSFTILSPSPRPFPWNILILMDDVTFME